MQATQPLARPAIEVPRSIGGVEIVRLVISYQRYAVLVAVIVSALLASAWTVNATWAWAVAGTLSLGLSWFGVLVAARLPHKLRLTRTQDMRIARGKFDADDLLPWVEDPCYRVVAREILVRSGETPARAREQVADLARRAAQTEGLVIYRKPSQLRGGEGLRASPVEDAAADALDQEETR